MNNSSSKPLELEKVVFKSHGERLRKPYRKPHLNELGDLRGLTLGPTPGHGESGGPLIYHAAGYPEG